MLLLTLNTLAVFCTLSQMYVSAQSDPGGLLSAPLTFYSDIHSELWGVIKTDVCISNSLLVHPSANGRGKRK